jgi:hypothetical protein
MFRRVVLDLFRGELDARRLKDRRVDLKIGPGAAAERNKAAGRSRQQRVSRPNN